MIKQTSKAITGCINLNRTLISFIIIILCTIQGSLCDCTLVGNATTGEVELLEIIAPLKGAQFTTEDHDGDIKYKYHVRICDKVPGATGNAGAVQCAPKRNYTLGLYNMTDIMGGTDWLMLTYYNGSPHEAHCQGTERITRIMIICDPDNVQGEFRILEEKLRSNLRYCFYLFELRSSVACSELVEKSTGLGSGGVFCVLFFTFLGCYFVLGFLYQRFVAGAKGLEQIPNYSFWRAFGNLQADGCDYICRCGPRQESQAYRGIDERLKTEEERDEQLLNM